ncbi:DHA2 family efflux MFS transporter permease subunit [Labedaea rhizosphaerae]|uniref:EmrB/QacA subfamily drug resistance transporter n=1 Tax=Labedaea rhizosphaerae TaxID=598644 RepID=A0A4R6SLX1_LABRH|nr:DHA2 family efflux MFS transporter permease subunit [Labedaea rhizosphaerae]TDQ04550.1 EmrB/QacA subfamily drug resistance transporter [Labedaea rhizosphaerae]
MDQSSYSRRWLALTVLLVASFMDLLDTTIVNVALPAIRSDIGASYTEVQWVAAGYTLAFAVGLITGGRLGDRYGRKRIFLLGMAGFTAFSTLCGVAPNPETLVAARVLQGLSAAMMVPQVLSTLFAIFPPKERTAAGGLFGGIGGLAALVGPLLSGLLIDGDLFGLGWRAIFLVNVPVGVVAMIAAIVIVPETRSPNPLRLDLPGVALLSAAMFAIVFPLVQGRELDWPVWTFVLMAVGPVLVGVFVWHARRREARDQAPLVPMKLFKDRHFAIGLSMGAVFFAAMSAFFLTFTLALQIGLGFTPWRAGLITLPFSVGCGIAIGVASKLVERFGGRVATVGAVVMAAGAVGASYTLAGDFDAGFWALMPWMLLGGVGMGGIIGPIFALATAGVGGQEAGAASGTMNAVNQLGGAIGVAVLGVLYFGMLPGQAATSYDAVVTGPAAAQAKACFVDRVTAKDPLQLPASCIGVPQIRDTSPIRTATADTFTATLVHTCWYVAGALVLVAVLSLWLPRRGANATQPGPVRSDGDTKDFATTLA